MNTKEAKAAHTPGPWKYREVKRVTDEHRAGLYGYVVTDAENVQVSEAFPLPCRVAVNEANARLIAAAPDLLAALQDALTVVSNHAPDAYDTRAKIEAAIIRATGGK